MFSLRLQLNFELLSFSVDDVVSVTATGLKANEDATIAAYLKQVELLILKAALTWRYKLEIV